MPRPQMHQSHHTVEIDEYEVWRAKKDLERLIFMFETQGQVPPPEFRRLQQMVSKMAAANDMD